MARIFDHVCTCNWPPASPCASGRIATRPFTVRSAQLYVVAVRLASQACSWQLAKCCMEAIAMLRARDSSKSALSCKPASRGESTPSGEPPAGCGRSSPKHPALRVDATILLAPPARMRCSNRDPCPPALLHPPRTTTCIWRTRASFERHYN